MSRVVYEVKVSSEDEGVLTFYENYTYRFSTWPKDMPSSMFQIVNNEVHVAHYMGDNHNDLEKVEPMSDRLESLVALYEFCLHTVTAHRVIQESRHCIHNQLLGGHGE